jgi:hypothetical protein
MESMLPPVSLLWLANAVYPNWQTAYRLTRSGAEA